MFGEYSGTRAEAGAQVQAGTQAQADAHRDVVTEGQIVESAHAKVNLVLLVGPSRADGYHAVATVLQTLELHDSVRVAWRGAQNARDCAKGFASGFGRIDVTSNDASLPSGQDNIAYRAAKLLEDVLVERGLYVERLEIHITKRIPVAAGLAGGSADAAAVLRALERGLRLGLSEQRLLKIGGQLGADVPACILSGAVFGRERGDDVVRLPAQKFWWVLINPGTALSAGEVYRTLDERFAGTLRSVDLSAPLEALAPGLGVALASGRASELGSLLCNDLQAPVLYLQPRLQDLIDGAKAHGAVAALVSGSGPTVAALVSSESEAKRLAEKMRGAAPWIWWGPTYTPSE